MFTWLQVHKEHNVEPLPHSPKELDDPRRVESAPRAHLLATEVTQRDLRSEDDNTLKFGWCVSGFLKNDSLVLAYPLGSTFESSPFVPNAEHITV